jgi:excisionase family DNA binding protein
MDGFAKIKPAAKYAGVSEGTFRKDWLKNGLKHVRLPSGTVLIKYSWVDEYLEKFTTNDDLVVENVVKDVLRKLR